MPLTLKPDMQIGDGGRGGGLGMDPRARVFQYEVLGWPEPGVSILVRDMRVAGPRGRWKISRTSDRQTWEGDFETAEAALAALQAELDRPFRPGERARVIAVLSGASAPNLALGEVVRVIKSHGSDQGVVMVHRANGLMGRVYGHQLERCDG
jgi:hypothetical protein